MVRTINGVKVPIGEDRKPKGRGTWVVVAIGLGVLLGAGGVGIDATVSGSAKSGSKSGARSGTAARVEVRMDAERSARVMLRLRHRGLRVDLQDRTDDKDCTAHAYGLVRQFLLEHPCVAMHRALLEVAGSGPGVVLVAIAWVQMPDEQDARAFKALVDRPGSGNIVELSREIPRYRNVRFTGQVYRSARDGNVVVNAQAQPVVRGVAGQLLNLVASDAVT
jgi:hypothetical protein